MDNNYCCVPQCRSRGNAFPRTSFHHFPSSIPLRNQWILKLKIGKEVSKRMVVCGKHFQKSDYFPGEKTTRRLRRNSVPSQNLPVGFGSSKTEEIFKKKTVKTVRGQERKVKSENFPPDSFESQEPSSNKETWNKKKMNHMSKEVADSKSKPAFVITLNKGDPSMKPKVQNLLSGSNTFEFVNLHEINESTFNKMDCETTQISKECDTETSSDSESEIKKISESELSVWESSYSINESSFGDSSCINKSTANLIKEEILQEKLTAMTERYKKTRKKMELYRHQWKLCVKQVDCLKAVIQNLKEINSVS